ncbi:MAG: hypothetical protein ACYSU0_03715 [Planctomycetota bacterium]|jgi:hypothetical protein
MTTGEFIAKVWQLFGVAGFTSIAAWAASAVLLAAGALRLVQDAGTERIEGAGARSRRRGRVYLAALLLAVTGYAASKINSAKVDTYRDDPEEVKAILAAKRKEQADKELPKEREGAAPVRFAEDGRYDRYDLAGVKGGKKWVGERGGDRDGSDDAGKDDPGQEGVGKEGVGKDDAGKEGVGKEGTGEEAAGKDDTGEEGSGTEDDVPDYKKRGKQERKAGRKRSEGAVAEGEREGDDKAPPPLTPLLDAVEESFVHLPRADVYLANRLDVVNLNAAVAVLLAAAALALFDYLRRFNSTDAQLLPLPLAALPRPVPSLVGYLSPTAHAVCIAPGDREGLAARLARAVRRGQTFIYFGERDPWPGDALPRLPFGLWGLSKIACSDAEEPGSEFVFESAWFGRYCFVVEGEKLSRAMLDGLRSFLSARQTTRARARAPVNIAWDHDSPPGRELLDELVFLCRETNFRLLVASRGECPADLAPLFDEIVPGGGGGGTKLEG